MDHRYTQLDSIRGLAAASVVIFHHIMMFRGYDEDGVSPILAVMRAFPLSIVCDGHAAVVLFFVLSGFVLSLPYHLGRDQRYSSYLVKRVCRIYPSYAVATVAALALRGVSSPGGIAGLAGWRRDYWAIPPDHKALLGHALLVPSFRHEALNPVVWTLVHEMRISLLFPLLMVVVIRFSPKVVLAGVLAASVAGLFAWRRAGDVCGDFALTAYYLLPFVAGALAARYRQSLVALYRSLPGAGRLTWLALALTLYGYSSILSGRGWLHRGPMNDYATTCGAALLIVACLGSDFAGSALRSRIPVHLGKVSYSWYLWHFIILLVLVNLAYPRFPLAIIVLLSAIVGLVVAELAHRWVEGPSVVLGRRLVERCERLMGPDRSKLA